MTRSRFSLLAAVALAASAAMSAAVDAFDRLYMRVTDACASLFGLVLRIAFGAPAPVIGDKIDGNASRRLSAASAFVKRLMKREKPRIEARWAMCPSI